MDAILSDEAKKELKKIAYDSIKQCLKSGRVMRTTLQNDELKSKFGAFVSLHKGDELRGCIGTFEADRPLYETVSNMAVAAATEDTRFTPLTLNELDEVNIEISVLSERSLIKNIDEIVVGKHGLYIEMGYRRGVLLPQVATEYKWDRETFLAHTCMKASLPQDAWKKEGIKIKIFTAEVF